VALAQQEKEEKEEKYSVRFFNSIVDFCYNPGRSKGGVDPSAHVLWLSNSCQEKKVHALKKKM
jgi:hypothetical protein